MPNTMPNKTIIGLTGNIAAGKSSVRRMLQHLGAFGIDADGLSHLAMAPGAPAFSQIVKLFGQYILASDGSIQRARLGKIAFSDPEAMQLLEGILHPIVRQAVDLLIARSPQPVVVVEAIKLLEGPLKARCDSIWVVDAPIDVRQTRLVEHRHMNAVDARQRILAQGAAEIKLAQADVVIQNAGNFEQTWEQVQRAWQRVVPNAQQQVIPNPPTTARAGLQVARLRPNEASEIAQFINQAKKLRGTQQKTRQQLLESFGQKAYLAVRENNKLVGLLGWQVENLVARVDELYALPDQAVAPIYQLLLQALEQTAKELQAEVVLLFLPAAQVESHSQPFRGAGYQIMAASDIKVNAWLEAVRESQPAGSQILLKKLREQRVLRPI